MPQRKAEEHQRKRRQLSQPKLVQHRKANKLGIILGKSDIQEDFYFVMSEGSLEEWHISNIDEHV